MQRLFSFFLSFILLYFFYFYFYFLEILDIRGTLCQIWQDYWLKLNIVPINCKCAIAVKSALFVSPTHSTILLYIHITRVLLTEGHHLAPPCLFVKAAWCLHIGYKYCSDCSEWAVQACEAFSAGLSRNDVNQIILRSLFSSCHYISTWLCCLRGCILWYARLAYTIWVFIQAYFS